VDNVTLELTRDRSSVAVRWISRSRGLPSGVRIIQYSVKYTDLMDEMQVGVVNTSSHNVTVGGLRTDQSYVFRVYVVIEETNGVLYEFGGSGSGLEIFVPGELSVS
jgi:hypothetical protein